MRSGSPTSYLGDVVIHQAEQLQVFLLRLRRLEAQDFIDQGDHVQRSMFQFQPAGLDLGEIEDIVDQHQEVVAGAPDVVQPFALPCVQFRAVQQAAEADDTVEGRADLMAHVGQKLRLGAIGLQGASVCQVELDVLDLDGFHGLLQLLGGLFDLGLQIVMGGGKMVPEGVEPLHELGELGLAGQGQRVGCHAGGQAREVFAGVLEGLAESAGRRVGDQEQQQSGKQQQEPPAGQLAIKGQWQRRGIDIEEQACISRR